MQGPFWLEDGGTWQGMFEIHPDLVYPAEMLWSRNYTTGFSPADFWLTPLPFFECLSFPVLIILIRQSRDPWGQGKGGETSVP